MHASDRHATIGHSYGQLRVSCPQDSFFCMRGEVCRDDGLLYGAVGCGGRGTVELRCVGRLAANLRLAISEKRHPARGPGRPVVGSHWMEGFTVSDGLTHRPATASKRGDSLRLRFWDQLAAAVAASAGGGTGSMLIESGGPASCIPRMPQPRYDKVIRTYIISMPKPPQAAVATLLRPSSTVYRRYFVGSLICGHHQNLLSTKIARTIVYNAYLPSSSYPATAPVVMRNNRVLHAVCPAGR